MDNVLTNKKLFVLIPILLLTFSSRPVLAEKVMENKVPSEQIDARKLDKEAQILADYLAKYDSPLKYHAQDFIDAAKKYNLDWKMLPAIAGVESTFGKVTPGGYNGWGWGVYGTQAVYFNSWTEGIFTVAKGLRENYLDRGLTDPYSINRAYATSPFWGGKVTYFMQDLDKFAQNYGQSEIVGELNVPNTNIAAISGRLVLK